jgi:translation machinery-associated protein 16
MAKGKHAPAKGAVREDKCIHPHSRKMAKFRTQEHRKLKFANKNKVGGLRLQILGEKLLWFHDNLHGILDLEEDGVKEVVTPSEMLELANAYMARLDDEIEQIKLKNSIGSGQFNKRHQHTSRVDVIELAQKTEKEEFSGCGLEFPDLLDQENLKKFLEWSGELRFIQNFKLKRFTKSFLESNIVIDNDNDNGTSTKMESQ